MNHLIFPRLIMVAVVISMAGCSLPEHALHDSGNPVQTLSVENSGPCQSSAEQNTGDPGHWLTLMECVRQRPSDVNFHEAEMITGNDWIAVFRRSILMSGTELTDIQRGQLLERTAGRLPQAAPGVRPLLLLWQEKQQSQLEQSQAEQKYLQLRQSSDSEIAALHQQQLQLKQQLNVKRIQLERLADIERQLSNRKPADLPDNPHLRRAVADSSATEKDGN